jgi:hypothetical protein
MRHHIQWHARVCVKNTDCRERQGAKTTPPPSFFLLLESVNDSIKSSKLTSRDIARSKQADVRTTMRSRVLKASADRSSATCKQINIQRETRKRNTELKAALGRTKQQQQQQCTTCTCS